MAELIIDRERCKGCEICVTFCPKKCIIIGKNLNDKGYFTVERDMEKPCSGCATCMLVCAEMCLEVDDGKPEKK